MRLFYAQALEELAPNNAQGEYYLTDIIAIARARGMRILGWRASDAAEFAGINSREELATMEADIRDKTNRTLMAAGVTFIDPATAYISPTAEIGADTVIGPNVQILGASKIGRGVRIEGTAWLSNVTIGDRCHLKLGVRAEECHIGDDSEIGPFAHLRAGTELAGHNRIGNFVETKKARLRRRQQSESSQLPGRRGDWRGDQHRMRRHHGELRWLRQVRHRDRRPLYGGMRHAVGRAGQAWQRCVCSLGDDDRARGGRWRAGVIASSAAGEVRLDSGVPQASRGQASVVGGEVLIPLPMGEDAPSDDAGEGPLENTMFLAAAGTDRHGA